MKNGFTQAMAWLHTWAGLIAGWLLFVIFVGGTLACFDKELSWWMRPAAHGQPAGAVSFDTAVVEMRRRAPDAHAWYLQAPSARDPLVKATWYLDDGSYDTVVFDPTSGRPLPATAGGEFFFTLHYNLHVGTLGMYLVGLAGMLMLAAIVTGVIIHRRIFKDFFTFRPKVGGQRAWLDGHNLAGVLGLPFHLMIAYTGVAIFVASYMFAGVQVGYGGDAERFYAEAGDFYERAEVQRPPGPLHPVDALAADASARLGVAPAWASVHHPDDASVTTSFGGDHSRHVAWNQHTITYDGVSGEWLHTTRPPGAGYHTYQFLGGLHMAQFGGAIFRWLYFLMGLSGCVMLASGMQVWLEKRGKRVAQAGAVSGYGLVRALNLGVVAGMPLACVAMLWGNRLLPVDLDDRAAVEIRVFCVCWVLAAAWALLRLRRGQPWRELYAATALLLLGLPVINALTAPHSHLVATLMRGDWSLAAVDLVALVVGGAYVWLARRNAGAGVRVSVPAQRAQGAQSA